MTGTGKMGQRILYPRDADECLSEEAVLIQVYEGDGTLELRQAERCVSIPAADVADLISQEGCK